MDPQPLVTALRALARRSGATGGRYAFAGAASATLLFAMTSCGSKQEEPKVAAQNCNLEKYPSEVAGSEVCRLACPNADALCEGPAARPVACTCTAGERFGHSFALDHCGALAPEIVVHHCASPRDGK